MAGDQAFRIPGAGMKAKTKPSNPLAVCQMQCADLAEKSFLRKLFSCQFRYIELYFHYVKHTHTTRNKQSS